MENEKLKYLTAYLLSEHSEWNDLVFPTNESEQFHLYRSLVNIRPAGKASAEYLKAEDEFLRGLTAQKGITSVADLQPVEEHIYLWKGDITTLQCGAIVNAANSGMTGCYHPCHNCIDNCIHTFAGVRLRLKCAEIMKAQGHENHACLQSALPIRHPHRRTNRAGQADRKALRTAEKLLSELSGTCGAERREEHRFLLYFHRCVRFSAG